MFGLHTVRQLFPSDNPIPPGRMSVFFNSHHPLPLCPGNYFLSLPVPDTSSVESDSMWPPVSCSIHLAIMFSRFICVLPWILPMDNFFSWYPLVFPVEGFSPIANCIRLVSPIGIVFNGDKWPNKTQGQDGSGVLYCLTWSQTSFPHCRAVPHNPQNSTTCWRPGVVLMEGTQWSSQIC